VKSDRRTLILAGAAAVFPAGAQASVAAAKAGPAGVHPGSSEDQTSALQRAIDRAAETRAPVSLPAGTFFTRTLHLRSGVQLSGVKGATRLVLLGAAPLIAGERCEHVSLSNLVLDGMHRPPASKGLLALSNCRHVVINTCEVINAGGTGIQLEHVHGRVADCHIDNAEQAGIFSRNAEGLSITGNTVRGCKNNGIQVWRSDPGPDGTLVLGNRIVGIEARAGGSGQNGNGINVFRGDHVVVANNFIQSCAFSAVRGNRANNLQIIGNNCQQIGEVALYVELGSEGAVVANNIVAKASMGVCMTNLNEGGRLGVIQGNLLRDLQLPPPPGTDPEGGWGTGIHVEADAAVTGNVVEGAAQFGLSLGWGSYLRDVNASGNTIRNTPVGIAISVTEGAGTTMVKNNLVSGALKGAIVGFDKKRAVTGDLMRESAARFAHLSIGDNLARP
jgi:uncharacterized secreted repeat protein (TIGR03808 family)